MVRPHMYGRQLMCGNFVTTRQLVLPAVGGNMGLLQVTGFDIGRDPCQFARSA